MLRVDASHAKQLRFILFAPVTAPNHRVQPEVLQRYLDRCYAFFNSSMVPEVPERQKGFGIFHSAAGSFGRGRSFRFAPVLFPRISLAVSYPFYFFCRFERGIERSTGGAADRKLIFQTFPRMGARHRAGMFILISGKSRELSRPRSYRIV